MERQDKQISIRIVQLAVAWVDLVEALDGVGGEPRAEMDVAVAEACAAIVAAPCPDGAAARLRRWASREREFARSPASLPIDDIVEGRTAGFAIGTVADRRRVFVHG